MENNIFSNQITEDLTVNPEQLEKLILNTPEAATSSETNTEQQSEIPNNNNPINTPNTPKPQGISLGNLVSAEFVVNIIDVLGKNSLAPATNKLLKLNITKSEIALSNLEKEALKEPTDAMLKVSNIVINNPFEAFVYAVGLVYGSKILGAYISKPDEPEAQTQVNDLNEYKESSNTGTGKKRGRPSTKNK